MKIQGLKYQKIDLHVHTPASRCYEDTSVTSENIVNKAVEERLEAIAIKI